MKRRGPLLAFSLMLTAGSLVSHSSRSQEAPPRLSDSLALPSQNLASTDDSTAVSLNPANLALRSGAEGRVSWTHTSEDAQLPIRGVSLNAAGSAWILGTGLQADWFFPPAASPAPFVHGEESFHYGWVRWGAALRFRQLAAIGTTLAWSHGSSMALDGHFTTTTGLTVRPHAFLSMAAVARDWYSAPNALGQTIDTSVDLGLALRPLGGDRMLEIGGTASYMADGARWAPGITLAADIPWLGRFHAGARMLDTGTKEVVANASVDMNIDRVMLRAGGVFGPALSSKGGAFHAAAALRSYRETVGVTLPARVVRLRIHQTPGVRQHAKLPTVESSILQRRLRLWGDACRDSPHSCLRACIFGGVADERLGGEGVDLKAGDGDHRPCCSMPACAVSSLSTYHPLSATTWPASPTSPCARARSNGSNPIRCT